MKAVHKSKAKVNSNSKKVRVFTDTILIENLVKERTISDAFSSSNTSVWIFYVNKLLIQTIINLAF